MADDGEGELFDSDDKKTSAFLLKTFNIISDPANDDIIAWANNGEEFVVKNEHEFASQLLPIHFRHRNFSSFVRQLNFYGFKKRTDQFQISHFKHPMFRQGRKDLLQQIRRRATANETAAASASASSAPSKDDIASVQYQVSALQKQYEDIWKIQNHILWTLSRVLSRDASDSARLPAQTFYYPQMGMDGDPGQYNPQIAGGYFGGNPNGPRNLMPMLPPPPVLPTLTASTSGNDATGNQIPTSGVVGSSTSSGHPQQSGMYYPYPPQSGQNSGGMPMPGGDSNLPQYTGHMPQPQGSPHGAPTYPLLSYSHPQSQVLTQPHPSPTQMYPQNPQHQSHPQSQPQSQGSLQSQPQPQSQSQSQSQSQPQPQPQPQLLSQHMPHQLNMSSHSRISSQSQTQSQSHDHIMPPSAMHHHQHLPAPPSQSGFSGMLHSHPIALQPPQLTSSKSNKDPAIEIPDDFNWQDNEKISRTAQAIAKSSKFPPSFNNLPGLAAAAGMGLANQSTVALTSQALHSLGSYPGSHGVQSHSSATSGSTPAEPSTSWNHGGVHSGTSKTATPSGSQTIAPRSSLQIELVSSGSNQHSQLYGNSGLPGQSNESHEGDQESVSGVSSLRFPLMPASRSASLMGDNGTSSFLTPQLPGASRARIVPFPLPNELTNRSSTSLDIPAGTQSPPISSSTLSIRLPEGTTSDVSALTLSTPITSQAAPVSNTTDEAHDDSAAQGSNSGTNPMNSGSATSATGSSNSSASLVAAAAAAAAAGAAPSSLPSLPLPPVLASPFLPSTSMNAYRSVAAQAGVEVGSIGSSDLGFFNNVGLTRPHSQLHQTSPGLAIDGPSSFTSALPYSPKKRVKQEM